MIPGILTPGRSMVTSLPIRSYARMTVDTAGTPPVALAEHTGIASDAATRMIERQCEGG
jgi:hypothetical protein